MSIFCLCQSPDFEKMYFKMAFSSFKGLCCFNGAMCYFSTYQAYAHQDKLHKLYWLLTNSIWTPNAAIQVMPASTDPMVKPYMKLVFWTPSIWQKQDTKKFRQSTCSIHNYICMYIKGTWAIIELIRYLSSCTIKHLPFNIRRTKKSNFLPIKSDIA